MEEGIIFSIIIPTYNSEQTLKATLESIKKQSIDESVVEVLIIDGGSTDSTLNIASRYKTKYINNPKRLPENAKALGIEQSKGKYCIFLDSDEILLNQDSLRIRLEFMEKHSEIKNLVSTGIKNQKSAHGAVRYANYMGDPFSNFVYGFYNGYERLQDMKKKYGYKKYDDGYCFHFNEGDIIPLFDALGSMFDRKAALEFLEEGKCIEEIASNVYFLMVSKYRYTAILEDDYVIHQPQMDTRKYMCKLKWRINNNTFAVKEAGYINKAATNKRLNYRKYLYVMYCILIVPVLCDTIRLCVKNKDFYFILHCILCWYILINAVWYRIMKTLSIKKYNPQNYH